MSTVLSKEALRELKGQDVKTKDIPVSEWGQNAVVRLCVMGGESQETFESMITGNSTPPQESGQEQSQDETAGASSVMTEGLRWALLSRTVVDENNNLVFESDEETKEVVGPLNFRTITNLVLEALDLNGLRENAVEEAEKNSSTTRPGASGTGSQGNAGGASRKRRQK